MEYISGNSFTFKGKNSSIDFGLILVEFDSTNGFSKSNTAQELNITKEFVGNNPRTKLINVKYDDVLKFDIGIAKSTGEEFSQTEIRDIHKWLMVNSYRHLVIDNNRYEGIHFNVIVTNIQEEKITDKIVGFLISFECDSPYGYETITNTYEIADKITISINNSSDDFIHSAYHIKPTITIQSGSTGSVVIKNNTLNRETSVSMLNLEKITMDSENMVITSSVANQNLYTKFNKVWFELALGINSISITGSSSVTITFDVARKVGI